jgi:WD40 repeat protein
MAVLNTFKHGDKCMSVAFSSDGKWLAAGGGENPVHVYDTSAMSEKPGFTTGKVEANALAFTPDGTKIVVGTQDNLVILLNASNGNTIWKQEKHERPVTSVVISPDGKTAYSASMDYTVRSWSIK